MYFKQIKHIIFNYDDILCALSGFHKMKDILFNVLKLTFILHQWLV